MRLVLVSTCLAMTVVVASCNSHAKRSTTAEAVKAYFAADERWRAEAFRTSERSEVEIDGEIRTRCPRYYGLAMGRGTGTVLQQASIERAYSVAKAGRSLPAWEREYERYVRTLENVNTSAAPLRQLASLGAEMAKLQHPLIHVHVDPCAAFEDVRAHRYSFRESAAWLNVILGREGYDRAKVARLTDRFSAVRVHRVVRDWSRAEELKGSLAFGAWGPL